MSKESLFDAIAKLLPEAQREHFYRRMAHLVKLNPDDELLVICEAMGFLALITRETPGKIADERAEIERVLGNGVQSLQKAQETAGELCRRVEAQLNRLPAEIASGLDPKVIASRIAEMIERYLNSTGFMDTEKSLRTVAGNLQAAMRDFSGVVDGFSHPQNGAVIRLNGALQQMEQRLGSLLRYLETQLQKLRWSMIRGVTLLCLGCLAVGVILGLLLAHS